MSKDSCKHECRNGLLERGDSNNIRVIERDEQCVTCSEFPAVISKALVPFRKDLLERRREATNYGIDDKLSQAINRHWAFAALHIQTIVKDWPDRRKEDLRKKIRLYASGNERELIEQRLDEALICDNWKDLPIEGARDVTPMIIIIETTFEFITGSKMPPAN